jgi:hypothetical protein
MHQRTISAFPPNDYLPDLEGRTIGILVSRVGDTIVTVYCDDETHEYVFTITGVQWVSKGQRMH